MMNRRELLLAGAAFGGTLALSLRGANAQAGTILIGYTASVDPAAIYSAQDEGFFAKRGLTTELQLVALNPTIPAALQSKSLHIANPSPPVFVAAIDGGLDLVLVGNTSVIDKGVKNFAAVARTGTGIATAADFHDKRIGVPGLNAFLHVIFKKWMIDNGGDPSLVRFVEVPFPQMADVMRGGTIDGVVASEPLVGRVVKAGVGTIITNMDDISVPLPTAFLASTREWAEANRETVKLFQEAVQEGVEFVAANEEKARQSIAKFTNLPIEDVNAVPMPLLRAIATTDDVRNWIELMQAQGLVRNEINPEGLVFVP